MRYWSIIFLFLVSPVFAQNIPVPQVVSSEQRTLVHNITIEGFILQDKTKFIKLFKPYRNKFLSTSDINVILQQLHKIYGQEGYQSLVSIEYQLKKKHLIFIVSLVK